MAKMTKGTREAIASLSTGGVGTYYPSHGAFFTRLDWVLRQEGFQPSSSMFPPLFHTNEGRGLVPVSMIGMEEHPLFDVVYTWYKMPSGNYEIVCYPSC